MQISNPPELDYFPQPHIQQQQTELSIFNVFLAALGNNLGFTK
jgi:hypothetical protein